MKAKPKIQNLLEAHCGVAVIYFQQYLKIKILKASKGQV